MTESCAILEELVAATSACPATDVIAVQESAATTRSAVVSGVTPAVTVSSMLGVSTLFGDAYALSSDSAAGSSSLVLSTVIGRLLADAVSARSSLFVQTGETVLSAAAAQSAIAALDAPALLVSAAGATSTLTLNTTADRLLESAARALSAVTTGLLENATSAANTVSTAFLQRHVFETVVAAALAGDEEFASAAPVLAVLVGLANARSGVAGQLDAQVLLAAAATATADVWYKNPARVAWLMNSETSAVSWYSNFDFESIAQVPGKVLAVGPDGLYELTGDSDSGEQIDAEVVTGFGDFDYAQVKRVDNLYFGYTSAGRISVTAEAYESGHPPSTFFLEERPADAPRNSRVTLGKGLWGRYWRMTLRNVDGVSFEVRDATVDVAISPRRL